MIGASGWEVLFYASTAALGIASLSFASVGYWLRNLYWWERLILLAGAIDVYKRQGQDQQEQHDAPEQGTAVPGNRDRGAPGGCLLYTSIRRVE